MLVDSVVEDLGMPRSCFARHFTPAGIYEGLACKESKQKGSQVLRSLMRARTPHAELW